MNIILAFLLTFVFLFSGALAAAEPDDLSPRIRAVMESPAYRYARWGLLVVDLESGRTVHAVNADTLMGPASVTKLFTAAAALDGLGRDFTFRTPVYTEGTVDKSGRLTGHLIVVAQGDIFPDVRVWAARIRAAGIKAVKGDLLIDDRLFASYRAYSVSRPGKLLYVVSPAMAPDSLLEFTIRPTRSGAAAAVTWRPASPWLRISSHVRTAPGTEPEKIGISEDDQGRITLSGQIPANSPALTRTAPVSDPASLLRSLLIDALKKAGVRIQAPPRHLNRTDRLPNPAAYGKTLKKLTELASPPLADYLHTILKTSHNQGADMLPLILAVKNGRRTFEEGMKLERDFLRGTGIDLSALSLGDGSGISPANLATPRSVVELLKFMTTHRDYAVFRDGFPVLGVDGTLAGAAREDSPARGKVLAKTGTIGLFDLMNDSGFVQYKTLAGYITAASGRPLAFALFVNHVHTAEAPDRKTVLKLTNTVGSDLAGIAEILYLEH